MKCEQIRPELPALLWGELSASEREEALAHLSTCASCRSEWREFQAVHSIMLELKDENPPADIVFLQKPSRFLALEKFWKWLYAPGAIQFGLAAAIILIALWAVDPNIRYEKGDFSFNFGKSVPQIAQVQPDSVIKPIASVASAPDTSTPVDIPALMKSESEQTLRMVADLLQKSSEDQRRDYALTLAAFARDMERQRQQDIAWMQTGLTTVQRSSQTDIMRTNRTIEDLIKNASYQPGK